jgi:hypothetical protein
VIYTARTNQKEFVVYFSDQRGVGWIIKLTHS